MRIFAISDLHVDYTENQTWVDNVSRVDYVEDLLILAGDLSDRLDRTAKVLAALRRCFREVFFVPGNHDLWMAPGETGTSLEKFLRLRSVQDAEGIRSESLRIGRFRIIPLLSWYDFSLGKPSLDLLRRWMDFKRCVWPPAMNLAALTAWFESQNKLPQRAPEPGELRISFSHFLPTLETLPDRIDPARYLLSPVLGASSLMEQVRRIAPMYHVFGHSHINVIHPIGEILMINNAYGYPSEEHLCRKRLLELEFPAPD